MYPRFDTNKYANVCTQILLKRVDAVYGKRMNAIKAMIMKKKNDRAFVRSAYRKLQKLKELKDELKIHIDIIFECAKDFFFQRKNAIRKEYTQDFLDALKISFDKHKKSLEDLAKDNHFLKKKNNLNILVKQISSFLNIFMKVNKKKNRLDEPWNRFMKAVFRADEQYAVTYEKKDTAVRKLFPLTKGFIDKLECTLVDAVNNCIISGEKFDIFYHIHRACLSYFDGHFMKADFNQDKLNAFMCVIAQLSDEYPRLKKLYDTYTVLLDCEKMCMKKRKVDPDEYEYELCTPGIIRCAFKDYLLGAPLFDVVVDYVRNCKVYESSVRFEVFTDMLAVMGKPFPIFKVISDVLSAISNINELYYQEVSANKNLGPFENCTSDIISVFFDFLSSLRGKPSELDVLKCLVRTFNELCSDLMSNKKMRIPMKLAFLNMIDNLILIDRRLFVVKQEDTKTLRFGIQSS
jgi:hypothetical protein